MIEKLREYYNKGVTLSYDFRILALEKLEKSILYNYNNLIEAFKHDYNNTLQTMYGYILTENMPELKNFFMQILDESRAITALDKLNPELFRNSLLRHFFLHIQI